MDNLCSITSSVGCGDMAFIRDPGVPGDEAIAPFLIGDTEELTTKLPLDEEWCILSLVVVLPGMIN